MTKRQAKKVVRKHPYGTLSRSPGLRRQTWDEASRKMGLESWRHVRTGQRLTAGYRQGRWDPKPSIAPWEVPF